MSDFHLEYGIRLNTESKYKNLYAWAINEVDAHDQPIDSDQIPWPWSLYFTATSCALSDSIEIRPEGIIAENATAPNKIVQEQFIRVQLRPGGGRWDDETTFSMFGTKRAIKDFVLGSILQGCGTIWPPTVEFQIEIAKV